MPGRSIVAMLVAAFAVLAPGRAALAARDRPGLAGRWTLNRQLSQFPTDLGFGMDLMAGAGSRSGGGGSGGRRSGGGGGALPASAWLQESEDDVRRRDQLVEEVRTPSAHLTITQTDTAVTITDDRGVSRTFHPNGREESHELDRAGVATIARWDGNSLEVRYKVEQYRELRYSYSRTTDPDRLVVQVRFVESGGHDTVTRVYDPAPANEPASPDRVAAPATVSPPSVPPPVPRLPAAPAGLARSTATTAPVVVQGTDAGLKGLTQIGLVVEDLSSQAAACGLSQAPIEAAVSKSVTDAGLKVLRNSDEDTYLYINVSTTSASSSLCVSRYDVFLYSHTTAVLPYQAKPVLAQVQLLHQGGIAGGSPAAHAQSVMGSIRQYTDEFAKRIRDANAR